MNPIVAYQFGYIPFADLEINLWDFGPNQIYEIGEKCFEFYCSKANGFHHHDYYILSYGSGLNADNEWYCE